MSKTLKSLLSLKDVLWSLGIVISLIAIFFGFIFTIFTRYYGPTDSKAFDLSKLNIVDAGTAQEIPDGAIPVGTLKMLGQTSDAGERYINGLTFLCDSTYIALRDANIVDTTVWGSDSGILPIDATGTWSIMFSDGSRVTPASAAMISKPAALVIAVGSDNLSSCSKENFISGYQNLVNGIKQSSPNTVIICCSIPPVTEEYAQNGDLSNERISTANGWIKDVCVETGAYFCDSASDLTSRSALNSDYASSSGKTLSIMGLQQFLRYLRTHTVSY